MKINVSRVVMSRFFGGVLVSVPGVIRWVDGGRWTFTGRWPDGQVIAELVSNVKREEYIGSDDGAERRGMKRALEFLRAG